MKPVEQPTEPQVYGDGFRIRVTPHPKPTKAVKPRLRVVLPDGTEYQAENEQAENEQETP